MINVVQKRPSMSIDRMFVVACISLVAVMVLGLVIVQTITENLNIHYTPPPPSTSTLGGSDYYPIPTVLQTVVQAVLPQAFLLAGLLSVVVMTVRRLRIRSKDNTG